MKRPGFVVKKYTLVFAAFAGLFLVLAFLNPALAQTEAQITAALEDLSQIYGEPVTSEEQAAEICNLEQYLADCAEIGKRHQLFSQDELAQVDAFLEEFKGEIVQDLISCTSEACLFEVASKLAARIEANNPAIASQFEFTEAQVQAKQNVFTAATEIAKEFGVDFEACRSMDPNTAPIDLLRSCARLAQDSRMTVYIPEASREAVEIVDFSIDLREALQRGEYSCGDNTLEGCGNFCLNASPETGGTIPQVCRDIASTFFGSEGVAELEQAHAQVGQVVEYYNQRAEQFVFTTLDGRTLYDPEEIGRYLEEEGRRGNVAAVENGMEFLVAHGFASLDDKEFVLGMMRQMSERGVPDFDFCRQNPSECQEFIPPEYREEFGVMEEIHNLMLVEMNKEGVPNPNLCEDPRYGEGCLRAAKNVLVKIEALAAGSAAAERFVEEIRGHIELGELGFEARDRAQEEFDAGGGILTIGNREFQSFAELDAFCQVNGQICLTEAAKKGFIEKDFAQLKYEQSFEAQFHPQEFAPGAFPGFQPPGFEGFPPGPIPGFIEPGPGFFPPPGFAPFPGVVDKADALRQFELWLDNPEGPPPIYQQGFPSEFETDFYPQEPYETFPVPPTFCSTPYIGPCDIGQYRPESMDAQGCFVYGECVLLLGYEQPAFLLPPSSLPTVNFLSPAMERCLFEHGVSIGDIDLMRKGEPVALLSKEAALQCAKVLEGGVSPGVEPLPITCDAYFEGYVYNEVNNTCEKHGTSGCDNPFPYSTLQECEDAHAKGVISLPPEPIFNQCGNNVCDSNETVATCPVDCGSYCGDGACTDQETPETCPNDCGSSVFSCPGNTNVCDFSACPSGCEWDSQGCTIGCVTASAQDPSVECANSGGTWTGSLCEFSDVDTAGVDPAVECANAGGAWDGFTCQMSVHYENFLAQTVSAAARLTSFIQGLFGR